CTVISTLILGLFWCCHSVREEAGSGAKGAGIKRVRRGWMWNQFFLQEEYTGSDYQYIGKLQSDQDRGDGAVKYVLSGEGAGSIFVLDENNGDLHATRRLDREEKAFYVLRATVVNKRTGLKLEPETEFVIKLHDINDNEPTFSKEVYTGSVPERSEIGTSVIQVTATDADDSMYGNSAKLVYSISQGHPYFSVDPNTGVIRTALGPGDMDREQREHYQVVIEAKDMAGQRGGLTGSTIVNITLTDVNDNAPSFTQSIYQFRVPESFKHGSPVGRVRATDRDIGQNAEMFFTIVSGDGMDVFHISTDKQSQEGVISVNKPLDYERKQSYTVEIQVQNTHIDPRFSSVGSNNMATVRISVEDVDEPPLFDKPWYELEVKEDAGVGSAVGAVSAVDPDGARSPVKYAIDRRTDLDRIFNVHPGNGSIFLLRPIDREESAWHNISVIASEFNNPRQSSTVNVYIKVLDINDNPPVLATTYETYVCEKSKARIQTISAVDPDEPSSGHRFFFSLAPEGAHRSNFTVRDNGDNTAAILTRRNSYSRLQQSVYLVAVVITDADYPMQSSTGTLTVRVCTCDRHGNMELCNAEALSSSPGLSTGALIAILLCAVILLMIVFLFAALKRQRKQEPLIISKEDVRDNVVSYNDEGGGEEDTQAFDMGALRHPDSAAVLEEPAKQRRDIMPTDTLLYPPLRRHAPSAMLLPPLGPRDNNGDVRDFINQRVLEHDCNPTAPPYDSLATYAYEGAGSVAESLSSLGSASSEADQDYQYLSEWGPRFRKLADLYGADDDFC
uniref:Cadherin domain-containing protein n=1 Tax=Periophthalmus magnuspinnatus TaxID=409849 RepID=A0A3B3ZGG1_9GOBI